jgi:hypothetical protein
VNTNGVFVDTIKPKGPGAASLPLTGFGVGFVDFDNDGELDAYVANGRVKYGQRQLDPRNPYAEPNTLVRGIGNGDFEEVKNAGTAEPLLATSRGAAFGDLDNDGGVDVVVINRDRPVHLLRNSVGKRGGWIMLRVLNRKGNDAIGAMVRVDAGGRSRWRQIQTQAKAVLDNDPRLHFGARYRTSRSDHSSLASGRRRHLDASGNKASLPGAGRSGGALIWDRRLAASLGLYLTPRALPRKVGRASRLSAQPRR